MQQKGTLETIMTESDSRASLVSSLIDETVMRTTEPFVLQERCRESISEQIDLPFP